MHINTECLETSITGTHHSLHGRERERRREREEGAWREEGRGGKRGRGRLRERKIAREREGRGGERISEREGGMETERAR